tara:strand:- start:929 stop:1648 length:720 start_codon:yes stop_codon:yes gene_type:complete
LALAVGLYGCVLNEDLRSALPLPPFAAPLRADAKAVALFMPTAQQVVPPLGYIGFCMDHISDCSGGTDDPALFTLDETRRGEMEAVNAAVNALPEIADIALYGREEFWTFADARGGDCEDLALEKRRRLMALGWPADAVLMATARDRDGDGHAVLIAATDKGDFVLDNQTGDIRLWSQTPYRWRARQSRLRPFIWLNTDATKFAALPAAHYPPLGRTASFLEASVTASLNAIKPAFPGF